MNKIELADQLRQSTGITKPMAQKVVKIFLSRLPMPLAKGERVEIRGLCSFLSRTYPSYVGRNPKTGKKIDVKPKKLPFFKVGKGLKELLNEADTRNRVDKRRHPSDRSVVGSSSLCKPAGPPAECRSHRHFFSGSISVK